MRDPARRANWRDCRAGIHGRAARGPETDRVHGLGRAPVEAEHHVSRASILGERRAAQLLVAAGSLRSGRRRAGQTADSGRLCRAPAGGDRQLKPAGKRRLGPLSPIGRGARPRRGKRLDAAIIGLSLGRVLQLLHRPHLHLGRGRLGREPLFLPRERVDALALRLGGHLHRGDLQQPGSTNTPPPFLLTELLMAPSRAAMTARTCLGQSRWPQLRGRRAPTCSTRLDRLGRRGGLLRFLCHDSPLN
jgi:hypothetical protein